MNDKLDHFVLEYDDASGNALLAMTEGDGSLIADGAGLPYALARGYDANARTWESIEPFDDDARQTPLREGLRTRVRANRRQALR